uniref:hypothetical protein n=1 Tax=Trichocoleus desertorum TaxID=1481672 RepID=UPI0025B5BE7C|nr:hypothetical protein [Trichocoleus desertorum]
MLFSQVWIVTLSTEAGWYWAVSDRPELLCKLAHIRQCSHLSSSSKSVVTIAPITHSSDPERSPVTFPQLGNYTR